MWRIIVVTGGREALGFELTLNVRRQSLEDLGTRLSSRRSGK